MTREIPHPATDHRRAIAERNIEAILDAAEVLLERRSQASIAAVATQASVSRVTVYAHFPSREALLEAVVERAVQRTSAALEAAEPDKGSPVAALEREPQCWIKVNPACRLAQGGEGRNSSSREAGPRRPPPRRTSGCGRREKEM